MNEIAALNLLTTEIKFYSQQGLMCFMEVGKRLVEARKLVPHGQWGEYIESNYEFSQRHANRLMEVYESFPNWTPESNLSYKKAYALLDVPAADRETFISQPHDVNGEQKTVDEMTSRELAATIKALKQAEKEKAERDAEVYRQSQKLQKLESDLEQAKVEQARLAEMKKPDTVTVEKRVEVIPPDYEATKQKLKDAMAKIDKLTDEQLGQAQAIFQQGKRAEIRSRLSMLAKDVGKHVKELELLVRILPGDESVSSDLTEIANILRDTADAVEQMESGVTIDAGFDSDLWPG